VSLPRRYLPPLHYLSAFEAAARLGSFSAAARELALTQSAVSKQVAALEARLEAELFTRQRQSVRLTAAGEQYATEVRAALHRLASASLNLRANPDGGTLRLAVLPTFATRWLAPRLTDFVKRHPGVTLNLVTRIRPFDFREEPFDAAITVGGADWVDTERHTLMPETLLPACSPRLKQQHGFATPADLLKAPLLNLETRIGVWTRWFSQHGVDTPAEEPLVFDQFAPAAQAAISGLGTALLPEFLIRHEIEEGLLVPALPLPITSDSGYHLVWPSARRDYPPLAAFRDWLTPLATLSEPST